jgi:hypothetical protein
MRHERATVRMDRILAVHRRRQRGCVVDGVRGCNGGVVMEAKHTPTPWDWSVGVIYARFEAGEIIAATDGTPFAAMDGATQSANAAYIVRACNSHAALVEALKECADRLELHAKHTEDLVAHMKACKALALAGETPE